MRDIAQLVLQKVFNRFENLRLWVEVLIAERNALSVHVLKNSIDFGNRPLSYIADDITRLKIALLHFSHSRVPTSEFAQLLILMMPDRNHPIIGVEYYPQSVKHAKVAKISPARKYFNLPIIRKGAGKLSQRKVMFRKRQPDLLNVVNQSLMAGDRPSLPHSPLPTFLAEHTCEIILFKNEQTASAGQSLLELGQQDGIARAVDVEPVRLVEVPLAIDVLAVGEVEKSGAVQFVVGPVRDVQGKVVVDEDAYSAALVLAVHPALVFAVTVINDVAVHLLLNGSKQAQFAPRLRRTA